MQHVAHLERRSQECCHVSRRRRQPQAPKGRQTSSRGCCTDDSSTHSTSLPVMSAPQLAARRWSAVGHKVVEGRTLRCSGISCSGSPYSTRRVSRRWAAIRRSSSPALHPSPGNAREIHLVVTRGAKVSRFAGVRVHESRRLRLKTSSSAVGCPARLWSGRRSTPQPGNRFLVLHL